MRRTAALVLAAVGLTACSSPSDGPYAGPKDAVPSTDVVSEVRTVTSLHDTLPADVRASGTLHFGTTLQPGTSGLPYTGIVGSTTVGLQVDLADAVAKVLGVSARLDNGTFPTIVPGVQNGKYDVGLANLGVTAEREQVVDYATYLTDGQAFLGGRDVGLRKVTSLRDLCGLTIATTPGSTFQQLLVSGQDSCTEAGKKAYAVQYFSTSAPIFLGLINGKVDAYFGPTLSLKYDAAHVPDTRFLGQISSTPVGFVTGKGSPLAPTLVRAVNTLIATGAYRRILAKWGVTASAIGTSQLNPKPTF